MATNDEPELDHIDVSYEEGDDYDYTGENTGEDDPEETEYTNAEGTITLNMSDLRAVNPGLAKFFEKLLKALNAYEEDADNDLSLANRLFELSQNPKLPEEIRGILSNAAEAFNQVNISVTAKTPPLREALINYGEAVTRVIEAAAIIRSHTPSILRSGNVDYSLLKKLKNELQALKMRVSEGSETEEFPFDIDVLILDIKDAMDSNYGLLGTGLSGIATQVQLRFWQIKNSARVIALGSFLTGSIATGFAVNNHHTNPEHNVCVATAWEGLKSRVVSND